jgi:hypothetical protein
MDKKFRNLYGKFSKEIKVLEKKMEILKMKNSKIF